MNDPALDALLLPFNDGTLPPPRDAAFLGARDGAALRRWLGGGIACEQEFRPAADALQQAGIDVVPGELQPPAQFATVLVLPPRQREQARALLARAIRLASPGGRVVACSANTAGARSMQDDLAALAGEVGVTSKHKCRVVWTAPLPSITPGGVLDAWTALDAARPILDGRYLSRPGLFAWDRIDPASALLVANLPADLTGHAADFGAGWGYLASELAARAPGIQAIDTFEAQARAIPVLQANLATIAARIPVRIEWADVTRGMDRSYDVIVSNPPFHADDRADRPELGQRFIDVAAASLRPGGRFWMVANRHLPYEATLQSRFKSVRVVAAARGFKVFEALK